MNRFPWDAATSPLTAYLIAKPSNHTAFFHPTAFPPVEYVIGADRSQIHRLYYSGRCLRLFLRRVAATSRYKSRYRPHGAAALRPFQYGVHNGFEYVQCHSFLPQSHNNGAYIEFLMLSARRQLIGIDY